MDWFFALPLGWIFIGLLILWVKIR